MVYILELPHWRLQICEHLTLSASAKSLKPKRQSERGEESNLEDQWQNKEEKSHAVRRRQKRRYNSCVVGFKTQKAVGMSGFKSFRYGRATVV